MRPAKDHMRSIITIVSLAGFLSALAALFYFVVPEQNRDMVIYMLGQLSGIVATTVAYWVGTSKSSSDKNEVMAAMQDETR